MLTVKMRRAVMENALQLAAEQFDGFAKAASNDRIATAFTSQADECRTCIDAIGNDTDMIEVTD